MMFVSVNAYQHCLQQNEIYNMNHYKHETVFDVWELILLLIYFIFLIDQDPRQEINGSNHSKYY